jgi:hypothetical protein
MGSPGAAHEKGTGSAPTIMILPAPRGWASLEGTLEASGISREHQTLPKLSILPAYILAVMRSSSYSKYRKWNHGGGQEFSESGQGKSGNDFRSGSDPGMEAIFHEGQA